MSWLEKYYRINEVAGISIHIHPDNHLSLELCMVIATGNSLEITKKITDLTSLGQLKQHLKTNTQIALNLSGKNVLQKHIEKTEVFDQQALYKLLPNARAGDFYIQNFISGDASFVSLVRRAEASKWLEQLKELGFSVLVLSLGPFVVSQVISQLNFYDGTLIFSGYHIQQNEQGVWTGSKYDESFVSAYPLKIANEKLDEKLVIAYAAAFQLVMIRQLTEIKAGAEVLDHALAGKLASRKIMVQAVLLLTVFFITLLVNFGWLSWLNSANGSLADEVGKHVQNFSYQQEVENQVKKKEAELAWLGWDGGIHKAVLIDQVAALIPEGVTLRRLEVNPLDPVRSRNQKQISFSDRIIEISGNSEKIIPVNEWIARIKAKRWVKDIRLENFSFNSELHTGQFKFTIKY